MIHYKIYHQCIIGRTSYTLC